MFTILYGINAVTNNLYRDIEDKANVLIATTDGSGTFGGHRTHTLEEIAALDHEEIDRIIICSMFVDEIFNSLTRSNIPENIIFFFNIQKSKTLLCSTELSAPPVGGDTMYAMFDLAKNIASYDAVRFTILAELERKRRKKKHLHFIIVPKHWKDGSQKGINSSHDDDLVFWRMQNIVKPAFELLESTIGVSNPVFREQVSALLEDEADIFPANYSISYGGEVLTEFHYRPYIDEGYSLCVLKAPKMAYQLVDQFIEQNCAGKKLVTLTMREYANDMDRNSHLDDWAQFAHSLDKNIYHPVVVRDGFKCGEKLPDAFDGISQMPVAALNLHVRFALYDRAAINMGSNAGPAYLFPFVPKTACAAFFEVRNHCSGTSELDLEKLGVTKGEDIYYMFEDNQILFWGEENYENFQTAFAQIASV